MADEDTRYMSFPAADANRNISEDIHAWPFKGRKGWQLGGVLPLAARALHLLRKLSYSLGNPPEILREMMMRVVEYLCTTFELG
jgi:hypothetical protein